MMLYVSCFRFLTGHRSLQRLCQRTASFHRGIHILPSKPDHCTPVTGILNSRHDWLVLYNYVKYLSTDDSEITRDKCISLLIGMCQMVQEQNYSKGFVKSSGSAFLCHHGTITRTPQRPHVVEGGFILEPSLMVRYLKYMGKMRPYYRIKHQWKNGSSTKSATTQLLVPPLKVTKKTGNDYSGIFDHLIEDATIASFKPIYRNARDSHIGPLRLNSEQLVTIPSILTSPFYFELPHEVDASQTSESHDTQRLDAIEIIDKCIENMLDHLLYYFQGEGGTNQLCLVTMFVATMLYGPKIRLDNNSSLKDIYVGFHKKVAERYMENKECLTFRSLAYLLNSSPYPQDMTQLCDFAAERIINTNYAIPLDYLENICFALSRARYENDALYEHISRVLSYQLDDITPTVCLNLLWSFSTVGKVSLVEEPLGRKVEELHDMHFHGLSPSFLKKSYEALKPHVSADVLSVLKCRIDGTLSNTIE